jgi:hypothetical protein
LAVVRQPPAKLVVFSASPHADTAMPEDPLQRALAVIEADPESAAALTLYALVSTLEYERAGCLFKLTKLRDLEPGMRQIAYGLMERMAAGGHLDAAWLAAKGRMDELVRGA